MRWQLFAHMRPPRTGPGQIPPRKLNLTELRRIADSMAREVGDGVVEIVSYFEQGTPQSKDWAELEGMLPDESARVQIQVHEGGPDIEFVSARRRAALSLGMPPTMSLMHHEGAQQAGNAWLSTALQTLTEEWNGLGRPVRYWPLILFPVTLATLIAASIVGFVVLLARGDLSVWLTPLVVLTIGVAYIVGTDVAERLARSRQHGTGGPLPIDFRVYEQVRERRATRRAQWTDRGVGLIIGLVLAVLTFLIQEALKR